MKIRLIALTALVLVAILLAGMQGRAGAQERVTAIKMLAPGTGWALKGGSLYWTSSNGASWTNITPPAPAMFESMSSVYFLDSRVGWVLFAGGGEEATFHLASTTDAGASWSVTPVTLPPPGQSASPLLGGGRIAFADAIHGWIDIVEEGGAAFAPGRLAMTIVSRSVATACPLPRLRQATDFTVGFFGTTGFIRSMTSFSLLTLISIFSPPFGHIFTPLETRPEACIKCSLRFCAS
jgi:hypothetical protein